MLFLLFLLLNDCHLQSQSSTNDPADSINPYCIIEVKDYTFKQLLDEGINTMDRQLSILNIPVKNFKFVINGHIRSHHFKLNKGKNRLHNTTFRAIAFSYPSVSPKGDTIMLSGLVTIPITDDNKPANMLVYHRIMAPSYIIAPSNSLPLEAVLTADNTICVFPDYYGCGITEGNPFAYTALNYHARCATDCVLAAFEIINDAGIELENDFYTWNVGYSQGGGYALAMHKYIETTLPANLASRINLKWSLCGGGVYTPIELYKHALTTRNMGSTPAVYLKGLQSIFYSHEECLSDLKMSDFFSDSALEKKLDSLLLASDDSLWEIVNKLDELVKDKDPYYYFSPMALDTNSHLFRSMATAFGLDDCALGWHPIAPVVIYHSTKDSCIPYQQASNAYSILSENNGNCFFYTPIINGSHVQTSVLFFSSLLKLCEDNLFKKYTKRKPN